MEVYDGTTYKCVSSTPAGSIEGYARVHVLGGCAAKPPAPSPSRELFRHSGEAPVSPPHPAVTQRGSSVSCREAEVHPPTPAAAVHGVQQGGDGVLLGHRPGETHHPVD